MPPSMIIPVLAGMAEIRKSWAGLQSHAARRSKRNCEPFHKPITIITWISCPASGSCGSAHQDGD
jgi:hypothetical protein